MEVRELTCIGCPMGCMLTVTLKGGIVERVIGNNCPNGERYARKEIMSPTRIVTTTVCVTGGALPVINVKTASDIPKEKIFDCIAELRGVTLTAPVKIGDVVLKNICGTGVDVAAA